MKYNLYKNNKLVGYCYDTQPTQDNGKYWLRCEDLNNNEYDIDANNISKIINLTTLSMPRTYFRIER